MEINMLEKTSFKRQNPWTCKRFLKNNYKKVYTHADKNGVFKTLRWIMSGSIELMIGFIYQHRELGIWTFPLDRMHFSDNYMETEYHCSYLKESDFPEINRSFGKTVLDRFKTRMKHSIGYLISNQNGIIGYAWSSTNMIKNEGSVPFFYNVNPREGFVLLYDAFIRPENRALGAHSVLLDYRFSELKNAGYKKAFGFIEGNNIASIRAHEKLGCSHEGTVYFKKYLWHTVKKNESDLNKVCKPIQYE
jgi:hypothetical protein